MSHYAGFKTSQTDRRRERVTIPGVRVPPVFTDPGVADSERREAWGTTVIVSGRVDRNRLPVLPSGRMSAFDRESSQAPGEGLRGSPDSEPM